MKVKVELNNDEVAALKSLNLIITGKELDLPALKRKADKSGESVTAYDGKTLISESKINPMFIIDIFQIAGTTYQIVKPIAEKIITMAKEFKDKWVETPRQYEDLVNAGYRYVIECRNNEIIPVREGELFTYNNFVNIYKILFVKDLFKDNKDITEDVIRYLILNHNK